MRPITADELIAEMELPDMGLSTDGARAALEALAARRRAAIEAIGRRLVDALEPIPEVRAIGISQRAQSTSVVIVARWASDSLRDALFAATQGINTLPPGEGCAWTDVRDRLQPNRDFTWRREVTP